MSENELTTKPPSLKRWKPSALSQTSGTVPCIAFALILAGVSFLSSSNCNSMVQLQRLRLHRILSTCACGTQVRRLNYGYDRALRSIQESLAQLDTPYVDLMLLHSPGDPLVRADTWQALEAAMNQVSSSTWVQITRFKPGILIVTITPPSSIMHRFGGTLKHVLAVLSAAGLVQEHWR